MKYLINSILFLCLCFCLSSAQTSKIRVACIGNSITYGSGLEDPKTQSYPAQLQLLLDQISPDTYEVGNFGRPGATVLNSGHNPYMKSEQWRDAKAFVPDIAVIHLGINDTDPRNWPHYNTHFCRDYQALIDTLYMINPEVKIVMANLTPINAKHPRYEAGTHEWRLKIRNAIDNVAQHSGLTFIDFETPLIDRQNLLPDGLHPNIEGSKLLALSAFGGITGDWGGLKMPPIYSDGMIMQRDRYLKINGRANAGAHITLTIDGREYQTYTDDRGDWSVTIPPLSVGKTYQMRITDGKDTISIKDILAGEVWIASGQSNMAFMLEETLDTESIANAKDPYLRFYDMKPIALTNSKLWPDSLITETNEMGYFMPTSWQSTTPEAAAKWSAVAYYFAKELREKLDVPVGVICNAIGGAPTESWIDIVDLEATIPDLLVNWDSNHYVQSWVQKRGKENVGDARTNRHPYQPGYLFATGVKPLGHFPIAGVIWYQGESNAQNTELHEKLFKTFTESWRRYFSDNDLPIIFAQLSSLNRPSWPEFRDSQRRLSQTIPNTYMAVTSDWGDSLDVHPKHKMPVGNRMARQALNHIYGLDIVPQGPSLQSVISDCGALVLTFGDCTALSTSDSQPVRTFEIAEIDGFYEPAEAEIINNKIILKNQNMKNPKYVRYGWQPFTRANLVNECGLPASTFKASAENTTDFEIEDGISAGVSACFGGILDGNLIMAGGCNFPNDPLAPKSEKRFYKGIYAASPHDMVWHRVGSMPEAIAYGVTVPAKDRLILIGGVAEGAPRSTTYLLDNDFNIKKLPDLPFNVDNAYGASIDAKVFVAGGNVDGMPSRKLLMLDLNDINKGWQIIGEMPGNPRVQPVMAAAKNAKGEDCLYIWGGFAGRTAKAEPTLEVDGLCYNLNNKKWTNLAAPKNESGEEVALGGGVATVLSNGKIAACGGVNKDVFIAALRNQPDDYLMHDIDWYNFNPYLFVFDTLSNSWKQYSKNSETARAGATLVPGQSNDFYLIGGELKPRIRTNQTLYINVE